MTKWSLCWAQKKKSNQLEWFEETWRVTRVGDWSIWNSDCRVLLTYIGLMLELVRYLDSAIFWFRFDDSAERTSICVRLFALRLRNFKFLIFPMCMPINIDSSMTSWDLINGAVFFRIWIHHWAFSISYCPQTAHGLIGQNGERESKQRNDIRDFDCCLLISSSNDDEQWRNNSQIGTAKKSWFA